MNPEGPQMSWQAPPTQYAPQYAAAPAVPAPQHPGRGPGQTAILRWVGAAVAVCLLLTGAVVLHRTVLSSVFGGAASPEEAVNQTIAAIEHGDLTRLGLFVPPDEVAGLGEVAKQAKRISSDLGAGGGLSGGKASEAGVQVSVKNVKLKTQNEQTGLTKVSIENADITASFDPAKVSGPMKTYLDKRGAQAKSTTITVRGADITTDGSTRTFRINDRQQSPFVMTVQRDGSWYVSPLFTLFQYATEERGYPTSAAAAAPGFGSPVEAAQGYLSALAKSLNNRDITEFARATGGVEGRLLLTYRNLVNSRLDKMSSSNFSVDVGGSQFRVLSVDGNTARVRPESLHLTITESSETHRVDWDGQCLKVENPGRVQRICLGDKSTIGPYTPLVERLDYLVAVRADGGWKASATRTVFSWAADALSWIGDAEMPVIKALTRQDPTELTKVAKVADTIGIGSTGTVNIPAIGPYVDGGYAVVTIPNPGGRRFAVYCRAKSMGCNVATLVTPSGKSQKRYAGGRGGETGDYKAILIAGTGDVEVSVESR